jgi:hypothetical protein
MTSQARIHVRDGGDDATVAVKNGMQAVRGLITWLRGTVWRSFSLQSRALPTSRCGCLTSACHTLLVALAAAGGAQRRRVQGEQKHAMRIDKGGISESKKRLAGVRGGVEIKTHFWSHDVRPRGSAFSSRPRYNSLYRQRRKEERYYSVEVVYSRH